MKVRVDHLLIGVGAVILLLGSIVAWRALRPDPAEAGPEAGLERLRDKPGGAGLPRFIRRGDAFSSANERGERREGWVESQTAQAGDPGELGADEAVDEFQAALSELEAAVDDGRRLSEREQAELYNRATGSFTALSAWANADDPSDRAALDDAYGRMMALMRQLELEPPQVDPDATTLRR